MDCFHNILPDLYILNKILKSKPPEFFTQWFSRVNIFSQFKGMIYI